MIYLLGFEFLSICMISRPCEHALVAKEMDLLHKWELNYLSTLFAFISCSFSSNNKIANYCRFVLSMPLFNFINFITLSCVS